MLSEYISAAMHHATYEILPDDGSFYGEIPVCPGVWANAATLEACRDELQEVLEDWILVRLWHQLSLPTVNGLNLAIAPIT